MKICNMCVQMSVESERGDAKFPGAGVIWFVSNSTRLMETESRSYFSPVLSFQPPISKQNKYHLIMKGSICFYAEKIGQISSEQ